MKGDFEIDISSELLGQKYAAPFGIAPVGLTGLMWPKAEIILAKTAQQYRIPFCLSTVATQTPETVGPYAGDMGWFQLYPPKEKTLRADLLNRVKNAGFKTLVITADVPVPSRRERTKRAGLSTPPKITPQFIYQGITHPTWTIATLRAGLPRLQTIEAYSEYKTMMSVDAYTRHAFRGNLSWEYVKEVRDIWEGPVILKGLLHPDDALQAVAVGCDGVVVSNHGGRQFDGAPASIEALPDIVSAVKGKTAILFDSGVRTGLDIMRALVLGADFVLLGRAFMYGVGALGEDGGAHVTEILLEELKNNMGQLGVANIQELKKIH
jgi:L-lactate dehydrogenase (cytochrome)